MITLSVNSVQGLMASLNAIDAEAVGDAGILLEFYNPILSLHDVTAIYDLIRLNSQLNLHVGLPTGNVYTALAFAAAVEPSKRHISENGAMVFKEFAPTGHGTYKALKVAQEANDYMQDKVNSIIDGAFDFEGGVSSLNKASAMLTFDQVAVKGFSFYKETPDV